MRLRSRRRKPVFTGRRTYRIPEQLGKIMGIADAGHDSDGIYRKVGAAKQFTCLVHTASGNIVVQKCPGLLIKYFSKIVWRQVDHIGKALN